MTGLDRERGAATVFVVMFAVVLLVLAGLVVDGGPAINARQRVADDVEQAARAGSQHIDVDELRQRGVVEIDPGAAEPAARAFLQTRGYPAGGVHVHATAQQVQHGDIHVIYPAEFADATPVFPRPKV